jgi:3-hydroxyisobutyrate dehydrogenase-like beta-hydroxyacid dehydrogenase
MALTVGFLGMGRMGSRVARNIAAAGYPVVVWNRTRSRAEEAAAGMDATVGDTAAEVAAAADVIVSMLADDAAVEAAYGGWDGALAGLRAGSTAVDMSTISPTLAMDLGRRVREAGAGMVDAPVSGSTATAETGSLLVMAGGEDADLERVRPILETSATRVVHVGGPGTGAAMKLAVNAIVFGLNQSLSESLVLAERAGIDRLTAYDVIASSAVAAPVVHYRRPLFEHPGEGAVSFTIDLAIKDLDLIKALAERAGASIPQSELNVDELRAASAAGHGQEDLAALAEYFRKHRDG